MRHPSIITNKYPKEDKLSMQIFSLHDLFTTAITTFSMVSEIKGVSAEEALKLIFLPFYEFSVASCVISLAWILIFWKNKGLIFSGLSHMFHIFEWIFGIFRRN